MNGKNSFVLYTSSKAQFDYLSDEQAGRVIKAVFAYADGEPIEDIGGMEGMLFLMIKSHMDRDAVKYIATCERNRRNGSKGGRPPKPKETQDNPKNPVGYFENPPKPKKADIDIDLDSDIDNDKHIPPKSPTGGNGFAAFWQAYPKKVGKGAAQKAWLKIKPGKALQAQMLQAISAALHSDMWVKDKGQYIPNPATWLNQRRWEDELEPSATQEVSHNADRASPLPGVTRV